MSGVLATEVTLGEQGVNELGNGVLVLLNSVHGSSLRRAERGEYPNNLGSFNGARRSRMRRPASLILQIQHPPRRQPPAPSTSSARPSAWSLPPDRQDDLHAATKAGIAARRNLSPQHLPRVVKRARHTGAASQ